MRYTLLFLYLSTFVAFGQNTITLDSCVQWAKRNFPAVGQFALNQELSDQNLRGINEAWLPRLSFGAQAVYQTEVVSLNFGGLNTNFPHDSYLSYLGLEQTLFDGGTSEDQRKVEKLSKQLEDQKVNIELYKLVDRINQLYINILLGRENLSISNLYKEDLSNRKNNIKNGVLNGLVLESSLNEIEAEILKTEQNIIELESSMRSFYASLSFLTAHELTEKSSFDRTPLGGNQLATSINRAELLMFDTQKELVKNRYALTTDFALPKITIGATGNYGRPGPNFINQDLRFFGSANISVKWNVSSLYGLNREKKKYEINTSAIELQRQIFQYNLNATLVAQNDQVQAIDKVISKDDEIIEKRHSVQLTAASQVENGKITVANYLTQLNAEMQAKLNKSIHEIKRMNVISTINTTKGLTNF